MPADRSSAFVVNPNRKDFDYDDLKRLYKRETGKYETYRQQGLSDQEAHDRIVSDIESGFQEITGSTLEEARTDPMYAGMLSIGGFAEGKKYDPHNWRPDPDLIEKWDTQTEAEGARQRIEEPYQDLSYSWEQGQGSNPYAGLRGALGGESGERATSIQGLIGGMSPGPAKGGSTKPPKELQREAILEGDLSRFHVDPTIGQQTLADPESIAAMRRAMAEMEEVYQGEGFSKADRARQFLAQQEIDAQARQARDTVLARQAARGTTGSGSELSALLQTNQGATQAKAMHDASLEADAANRAMQAMEASFAMGGNLQGRNQAVDDFNRNIERTAHIANITMDQMGHMRDTGEQRSVRDYNSTLPFTLADYDLRRRGLQSGAASDVAGKAQAAQDSASADYWRGVARDDAKKAEEQQAFANFMGGLINTGQGAVRTYFGDYSGIGSMAEGTQQMTDAQKKGAF